MFNKALFKQSVKANGWMWLIITVAECFMLSCVMVISGNGNVGNVKNSVEDTIVQKEIDAAVEKRSLNYYDLADTGLSEFDTYYIAQYPSDYQDAATYQASFDAWAQSKPTQTTGESDEDYAKALATWKAAMPEAKTLAEQAYALAFSTWEEAMPKQSDYTDTASYTAAMQAWQAKKPSAALTSASSAFYAATLELKNTTISLAKEQGYTEDSDETKEMLGAVMYALKPTSDFNDIYTAHEETVPADYDVTSLISHIQSGDSSTYISTSERVGYREKRAQFSSSVFLGDNMTKATTVSKLLATLSEYGVTDEKYASFGYTYASVKHTAYSTIVSFQARYDYEKSEIDAKKEKGEYADEAAYQKAIADMKLTLTGDLSKSLLASLPEDVSSAIEEVGKMDLYSLIVGSIFFKIAGLLLPFIYTIMASNNLIATQVDTGSMAYVLSTGTKRHDVTFTQACFLSLSLLAMFLCTLITSCICFSAVNVTNTGLNYGRLCLINLGAFLVVFAVSGLNFFTSCHFDRTKNSMALGGGLSIFFLVATILGLFGSPVIPSVVRFDALNNFNYVSIITLFDVISITKGTTDYLWKDAILLAIGLIGYVAGSLNFEKKDLPL
jgi:ABC-2 type transport system permease protein